MTHIKSILSALFFLYLYGGATGQTRVELVAETKQFVGDITWNKSFGEKSKFNYFSRNRFAADLKKTTSFYSLNSISYDTKFRIDPLLAFEFDINGVSPRAGIQYLLFKKDVLVYAMLNALLKDRSDLNFFGYRPTHRF